MDRLPRQAVIPLSGLGTRLLPLSYGVPKDLLPIGGRSLLHHAMREAAVAGIQEFILVLPRDASLRPYFLDREVVVGETQTSGLAREWFSLLERVTAVVPPRTDLPGGFASAVASAERFLTGEHFAVMLADAWVCEPEKGLGAVVRAWQDKRQWAVGVTPVCGKQFDEFGEVHAQGPAGEVFPVAHAREKPGDPTGSRKGLGIAGRYVFDHTFFGVAASTQETVMAEKGRTGFHITGAIDRAAREGRVTGVVMDSRFFHAGTMEGYLAAWRYWTSNGAGDA
jgi:UTP--glucose-1-phosphate uridylyltransferase